MASATTTPRQGLRSRTAESVVTELLARAGVRVGGGAPHDIEVHDRRFYATLLRDGALGMGESYMEGWWNSPSPDRMIDRIVRAKLEREVKANPRLAAQALTARVVNMQSRSRANQVAKHHYDANDDVYAAMLDADRIYSCAYWRDESSTLEQAQQAKLDLICRKVGLHEGMSVLDIGCGWGGFAKFAAERYGARVVATNIAEGQVNFARRACEGLPVEVRLEDYRDTTGQFDAIVSVGMFEHVGPKNYKAFMQTVDRCLSADGVALLHTIAGNLPSAGGPWIKKYIFPNGVLPTLAQISEASEGLLVIEDVHNFGPDYDRTLVEWDRRFEAAWPGLSGSYDQRFRRMWRYYLLSSAAGFRSRNIQLFQVAMTRTGATRPDTRQV